MHGSVPVCFLVHCNNSTREKKRTIKSPTKKEQKKSKSPTKIKDNNNENAKKSALISPYLCLGPFLPSKITHTCFVLTSSTYHYQGFPIHLYPPPSGSHHQSHRLMPTNEQSRSSRSCVNTKDEFSRAGVSFNRRPLKVAH